MICRRTCLEYADPNATQSRSQGIYTSLLDISGIRTYGSEPLASHSCEIPLRVIPESRAVMTISWKRRLSVLATCLCAVCVGYAPLIYGHVAFAQAGVSRNDAMFFVVLPFLSLGLMVGIILLARRTVYTDSVLGLDWTRSDGRLNVLGAGVLMISLLAIDRGMRFVVSSAEIESGRVVLSAPFHTLPLLLYLFRFVLITPFVEEAFWRGYVQGALSRALNPMIGLFLQAALFAVFHIRNSRETIVIFLFAIVLGAWRHRHRTLLPLIAAHAVVNLVGVVPFIQGNIVWRSIRVVCNYGALLQQLGECDGYTPDQNADAYYSRAFELFVRMPNGLEIREFAIQQGDLEAQKLQSLRDWLAANRIAIAEFEQGTRKRYWVRSYGKIPFEQIVTPPFGQEARGVVVALLSRARLSEIDGSPEAAISDILACYRFGLHLMGPKPLNEQTLGLATQEYVLNEAFKALLRKQTDGVWLADLQTQLEDISARAADRICFSGQRFVCHDIIQRSFTCDDSGEGRIPSQVIMQLTANPRNAKYGIEPWYRLQRKMTTRLVDDVFAYLESITHQIPVQLLQGDCLIQDVVGRMARDNVFLLTQIDRFEDYYYWAHQCDALRDAVVVTAGILRYHSEMMVFPETLNELVERGYILSVPSDPFSGSHLLYRRMDRSFVLYSCGPDFDDDNARRAVDGDFDGDDVFWPITETP